MRRLLLIGAALLIPAQALAAEAPAALTLEEAYRLALKRSEDIAISEQTLHVAQGHFYQAFDVILPSVDYVYTNLQQDAPEGGAAEGGATGNSLRRTTAGQRISFSQPLFSGFKEFAALQGAGAEKSQRRHEIRRAKHLLFVDVAESFYALLQARRDVEIFGDVRELMLKRRAELEERAKLGRSRESEVHSAVSELKVLEADLETSRRVEILARQLLEFYIGRPVDEPLMDEALPARTSFKPSEFSGLASQRDDVKALEDAKFIADKSVIAAQSDLFPHVSLDGNYYLERVGFQKDIDWDLLLTVDVPLFDAETYGSVKVESAERKQAELLYSKQRRTAELEIKNAYEEYESSVRVEDRYREATEAAKKNYDFQADEYRLSLINNVQVLDTLREYQDIRRRYNQSQYQTKKDFWALRVALGESPVDEGKRV